jgi:hypothetical protein
MPFRSERQRKFMWAKHPDIARRWSDKYGSQVIASGARKARKNKKK